MTPLFSIIVPVYKVAPYLRECLDSVLAQTYTDWECICVDDGSPDESGVILDGYARQDARFRVLHRQNGGVSAARNAGMDIATGDYLLFLDGDDAYVPWSLERLAEILAEHPQCDILRFRWLNETDLSATPSRCRGGIKLYTAKCPKDRRLALSANVGTLVACNACYRRVAVGDVRFRPLSHNEDILFGAEVAFRSQAYVFLDEVLYRYRIAREGSATSKESLGKVRSVLAALRLLVAAFTQSNFRDCSCEFSRIVMRVLRIVFTSDCELGSEKDQAQAECVQCAIGLVGISNGCFSAGLRRSLDQLSKKPTVETYARWLVEPLNRMDYVCQIRGMGRILGVLRKMGLNEIMEMLRCYDF